MKSVAAFMCLGSLYTGALWVEYRTALLLGTGCFLFATGAVLTLVLAALYRAPEGRERPDGFHVGRKDRRIRLFRYIRFSQPARARQ